VARFDSSGFLFIVDRKKELIKYKGEQVAPAVLEDLLLSHPGVADCCVIGRPDTAAGELPMAFVVPAPGHRLDEQAVKDFVASMYTSLKFFICHFMYV
jgi:4-coumarate--CoA ligase